MATYLLYARSGKEFDVEAELAAMGINVWCGRVIKWRRVGKRRRPDPHEEPALPNYLFADMSPDEFYRAQSVKFLASTMMALSKSSAAGFEAYKTATERAYSVQDALREKAVTPMPEFAPHAPLQPISGPFVDLLVRFRRVVNPDDPLNRKVEVDGPLGVMQFDALDVRAAE